MNAELASRANEKQQIWEAAKELIRAQEQISAFSYETWIMHIEFYKLVGDEITLLIGKEFQLGYVKSRYGGLIEQAIAQVYGKYLRVNFMLKSEAGDIKEPSPESQLGGRYTFENFIVGSSNRFANAAALAVANSPGAAYNPLFIYGGVGLGKTHLMHAIANHVRRYSPEKNLLYVTSENFTNELISAIKFNRNQEFRDKIRSLDVLLIDDIQFIAGKESTQEEFFHTFNTLYQANKQIVLSSDKQPSDIPGLEERLVSRFACGLVADIQRPDFETTVAILKNKAEAETMQVPNDVLSFIASRTFTSIREAEGCLTRVIAYVSLVNMPLTLEVAQEALQGMIAKKDPRRITPELILGETASYFGKSVDDLKSGKRDRDITAPRHVAMYLIRSMLAFPTTGIGAIFGGRDHTTVMHACEKINRELKQDRQLEISITDIKKRIEEA